MGMIDLKIEHIRASKHWNKRHKRLEQLNKTTPPQHPNTSKFILPNGNGHQPMDLHLHEAAKNGDVDVFLTVLEKLSQNTHSTLSTIFTQLTPQQDTFLHIAANYGHEELTGFIAHHFGQLIVWKNCKGDSALHLAARAGHFGVVEILLEFRNDQLFRDCNWDDCLVLTDEERVALIRQRVEERVLVNDEGNTALHEALFNDHEDVFEYVMNSNTEAAYFANKQGKSPLYMVVEAGQIEYVKTMLHKTYHYMRYLGEQSKYMDILHEKLTKGKSLLHAAINKRNIEILQEIVKAKPFLVHSKDEDGQSPLEFALSTGFLEAVNYLQHAFGKDTSASETENANQKLHKHAPDLKIEDIRQSKHWKERHRRLQKLLDAKKVEFLPQDPQHIVAQKSMDLPLYRASKKGDIDSFINALNKVVEGKHSAILTIEKQLTPLQNTILHVAASFGNEELTGFIVHHFRSLLSKRNHKGDTPLHLAARAGHHGVVDILTRFQKDQLRKDSLLDVDIEKNDETLIGKLIERVMVNDEGNTPLHEALINHHEKVVQYLIKENVEEAYYVNNEGKSALYMAVETQNIDCVKTILSTVPTNTDQLILDEEVKRGKSLLQAAITTRNIGLLREVANMKPSVIYVKDEDGQTSLQYAVSTGFVEGVHFLLDQIKMDASERNADGSYPIHLASKFGHVGILEQLLQHCPDAREFINQDGQTILHVAAKYGKDSIVRYILKTPGLEVLLNEKDKDGNTPLHLATMNWHPKVVSSLTWDRKVDIKVVNNEGLTALDAAEEYMEAMASYRKRLTWMALKSAGVPPANHRKTPKLGKLQSKPYEPYNMDYCKDRVNTLLVVSTLIATVTFAAGFTMPGGYNSSEPDQGVATLLSKRMFQVFVICDSIAMYSAIMVTVTLVWAQLGDLTLVLNALRLAIPLLGISLTMMSLAFMASVYLVVSTLVWLANVVLTVGIISLTSLLTLFVPFSLPYTSNFPVARYISYYPSCMLMLASGCYYDCEVEDHSV